MIYLQIAKSLPPVWSKHTHMGFFGTFTGEQRINIKLHAEVIHIYQYYSVLELNILNIDMLFVT